jgi:rhodanese-related sulfurtransferase
MENTIVQNTPKKWLIIGKKIAPFFFTALITALVIYLTPLKHIALIEPTIRDIDAQKIYTEMTANPDKYIFIDVRPVAAYTKLHAQGAMNIELYKMYYERKNLPKHGKKIVLICSGGVASGVAFSYLEHYGFFNIYRVEGGIENWVKAGLPVVSAAQNQSS